MQIAVAPLSDIDSVSIRTRHFCRVMRDQDLRIEAVQVVSIRTRHFCRVMRITRSVTDLVLPFQSAPGISAG